MDNVKLKEFVLKELQNKAKEFGLSTINEPLVDKLVAEFCEKNPDEFAVLNTFGVSDEKSKEITENIATAIADGTIERIKYEQIVNYAGLAYHSAVMNEYSDEIKQAVKEFNPDNFTEEELKFLMQEK
jgi:geranylgeranyl pyrophosphate synthase